MLIVTRWYNRCFIHHKNGKCRSAMRNLFFFSLFKNRKSVHSGRRSIKRFFFSLSPSVFSFCMNSFVVITFEFSSNDWFVKSEGEDKFSFRLFFFFVHITDQCKIIKEYIIIFSIWLIWILLSRSMIHFFSFDLFFSKIDWECISLSSFR